MMPCAAARGEAARNRGTTGGEREGLVHLLWGRTAIKMGIHYWHPKFHTTTDLNETSLLRSALDPPIGLLLSHRFANEAPCRREYLFR